MVSLEWDLKTIKQALLATISLHMNQMIISSIKKT